MEFAYLLLFAVVCLVTALLVPLSLQEPTIPRRSAAIHHCLAGADFVFRSDHRESQPSTIARKFCSTASKPPVQ